MQTYELINQLKNDITEHSLSQEEWSRRSQELQFEKKVKFLQEKEERQTYLQNEID